jgi:hypothetical protein
MIQVFSHWLLSVETWVESWVVRVEFVVGTMALGRVSLQTFQFSSATYHLPSTVLQ